MLNPSSHVTGIFLRQLLRHSECVLSEIPVETPTQCNNWHLRPPMSFFSLFLLLFPPPLLPSPTNLDPGGVPAAPLHRYFALNTLWRLFTQICMFPACSQLAWGWEEKRWSLIKQVTTTTTGPLQVFDRGEDWTKWGRLSNFLNTTHNYKRTLTQLLKYTGKYYKTCIQHLRIIFKLNYTWRLYSKAFD